MTCGSAVFRHTVENGKKGGKPKPHSCLADKTGIVNAKKPSIFHRCHSALYRHCCVSPR